MNETVFFFEKDGHKRRGERANCKVCNTGFIRRLKPYPGCEKKKYCTQNCAAKAKQKRLIFQCYICNAKVERKESAVKRSRHGVYFCGRECKDFAQSLEGNCKAIQPGHYGNGQYSYHTKCRKELREGCDCGEKKRYKLVVHHKDKNRGNNQKSNLEVVCWNCHAVRHLKITNGKWVFDPRALTPRYHLKELT